MERDETFWINVFDKMAEQDYVVIDDFLEEQLIQKVTNYFSRKEEENVFHKAAIGSSGNELIINEVRGDYTFWLEKSRDTELMNLFNVFDEVKN